jgi:hypothetical protein
MSQETANLLIACGKSNWVKRREHFVEAKGKGTLQTYWLVVPQGKEGGVSGSCAASSSASSVSSSTSSGSSASDHTGNKSGPLPRMVDSSTGDSKPIRKAQSYKELESSLPLKTQRLVRWNCDVLSRLLKQIMARRIATGRFFNFLDLNDHTLHAAETEIRRKYMVLEEVVEIIPLPGYDERVFKRQEDPTTIELPHAVVDQLSLYVATIALMYRDNPFHNFEHASHVMMSVSKLLSRIVSTEDIFDKVANTSKDGTTDFKAAHDHTVRTVEETMTA